LPSLFSLAETDRHGQEESKPWDREQSSGRAGIEALQRNTRSQR